MYRYEETLTQTPYRTAAWRLYTEGCNIGFLDLETTGLSHRRDQVILGGLLRVSASDPDHPTLIQLLAETPQEEASMLQVFWEEVSQCDVIVTYNGDSFDLPFLKERLRKFHIASEDDLASLYTLDLYRIFQNYCPMAGLLSNLKQKTVEEALGLSEQRTDEIDGAESVKLYETFASMPEDEPLSSEKDRLRQLILLHNRDDIHQLSRLMKILDKVDLHRVMSRKGFPLKLGSVNLLIDSITLNKKEWRFELTTQGLDQALDMFTSNYRLIHDPMTRRMSIQISAMYLQNCVVVDMETLPGDYSSLARYPSYESGYLILHDSREVAYAPMNHAIKLFLSGLDLWSAPPTGGDV